MKHWKVLRTCIEVLIAITFGIVLFFVAVSFYIKAKQAYLELMTK